MPDEIPQIQIVAAILFGLALIHTFSTPVFERLAHTQPRHAGLWHLLGEVEVVFGFWALILVVAMGVLDSPSQAVAYLDGRNFTEPLFVFAIMVIAGTRPVLQFAASAVTQFSRWLPWPQAVARYWVVLSLVPLLGSFITEPAAMTLAALMLRDSLFAHDLPPRLKYLTLGVLFVNISIGGTLTPFAAPPVLMVAGTWQWDMAFMISTFGWKAAVAVLINASAATLLHRKLLAAALPTQAAASGKTATVPPTVIAVHLLFLAGVVVFAHDPVVFIGLFLFFLGFTTAYPHHQERLILREALLVAFFLAGLVVLGGQQQWWLQPVLLSMDETAVFFGATALTALTDNAALTYLGAQVQGLSPEFKVALVAGAVTGGGLTVVANAPNPAGIAIVRSHFPNQTVSPLGLLMGAIAPTLVAMIAFRCL